MGNDRQRDTDKAVSATPTLRGHSLEKDPNQLLSEGRPQDDASDHTHAEGNGGKGDDDVLVVDWEGDDDPQNPKKCVLMQLDCLTVIHVLHCFNQLDVQA